MSKLRLSKRNLRSYLRAANAARHASLHHHSNSTQYQRGRNKSLAAVDRISRVPRRATRQMRGRTLRADRGLLGVVFPLTWSTLRIGSRLRSPCHCCRRIEHAYVQPVTVCRDQLLLGRLLNVVAASVRRYRFWRLPYMIGRRGGRAVGRVGRLNLDGDVWHWHRWELVVIGRR